MYDGKLKERELLTLKCATSPKTGEPCDAEHSDGGKLYLVVPARGNRRWIFKYRWQGKTRRMGLGTLELVGLQRARGLAYEARVLLHDGVDPMDPTARPGVLQAKEAVPTFLEFATKIRNRCINGMAKKSVQRWDRGVNIYAKSLHDLPIDTITRHEVKDCLEPIWLTIQVGAKKFQGQLYDIFTTAIAAEIYPEGKANPADWEILQKLLSKQTHEEKSHKSLPYEQLPAAWQRLAAIESIASLAAQFIILTAVRTGEGLQLTKNQIDPHGVWHIPGKVMKNKKPANVPLSAEALAVVRKAIAHQELMGYADRTDLVFPGLRYTSKLSENAVCKLLQTQVGIDGTTHGCRSTFRSWGGDQDGIARDALEHCLHHIVGDAAESAYNKAEQLEKRHAIFQAWADYTTGKIPGRLRRRPQLQSVA